MSLLYLTYKHFFHVISLKQKFMAVASPLSFHSIVCQVPRVAGRDGLSPVSPPDSPSDSGNAVWMDCSAPWDCPCLPLVTRACELLGRTSAHSSLGLLNRRL